MYKNFLKNPQFIYIDIVKLFKKVTLKISMKLTFTQEDETKKLIRYFELNLDEECLSL